MELPYTAGLFDGEGSVTITKPSPKSPRRHRVIVQIAMTHKPTIDALHAEYGGRVQRIEQSRYNNNAVDRYDWRLTGQPALDFLAAIRPWLITKARAADIACEFVVKPRGTNIDLEIPKREALRLRLREENRRGRADS